MVVDGRTLHKSLRRPGDMKRAFWPSVVFYDKQWEIVNSVRDNRETIVVAGNQLGKDYIAGFIALSFFLRPQMYFADEYVREIEAQKSVSNPNPHTVRIITTSVKDEHINVLWSEIGRYINNCRFGLEHKDGGPLIVNHRQIRKVINGQLDTVSYLKGMVTEKPEGLAGHHAAYTLMIADEASGVENEFYEAGQGWMKKFLAIGNPMPCANFFYRGVEAGDAHATSA